jgi:hypothetical protein
MATMHRAQILLEPDQHRALLELARAEERSLSDLVREIVRTYLAERSESERRQRGVEAVRGLSRIRGQIREEHGGYAVDLLAQAREEREQDMERVWRGDE